MEAREKTSIAMTPKTRRALDRLQSRLRDAGVPRSVANASEIIEALIANADFDRLLDKLTR